LPQQYNATIGGREVATFKQTKNPLLIKIQVDFSPDSGGVLDRRPGFSRRHFAECHRGQAALKR
jgi:hypothetical protein